MNSFKLFNIKSFSEYAEVELKKINIFVGRNSSGKSSLIRFPVVLSQTFQEDILTPLLLFGKLIDYGNFDDVIYNHKGDNFGFGFGFSSKDIRLGLLNRFYLFKKDIKGLIRNFYKNFDNVDIEIKVKKINKKIIVDSFCLFIDKNLVLAIDRDAKRSKYDLRIHYFFNQENLTLIKLEESTLLNINVPFNKFIPDINLYGDYLKDFYEKNFGYLEKEDKELYNTFFDFIFNREIPDLNSLKMKNPNIVISSNTETQFELLNTTITSLMIYSSILSSIYTNLNKFSNEVTYIGPFRENPERVYRDSENSFNDVGKNGENTSLLLRQADQQRNNLLSKVSDWFESSMGYTINIDEIENSNLFKVVVSSVEGKNKDNLIDVGYGIAQVLPIVTQVFLDYSSNDEIKRYAYRMSRKSVVIIEQPELHLHPAAQANLANLFVDKVLSEGNSQMLIETHSEHLIRRIQVLIADPDVKINNQDVAFYYVDKNNDGSSCVKKMDLNEKGQFIDEWPSGFFDKGYELSKELLTMSKKRGIQNK
ncbi:hypothetical protein B4V02_03245 [Paenibacillus kribbensis]|jgi:predicted ATPase|uniref:AAA domain-containing protein n=1 Tax=Paenibacillus kribbensis TaxID=172713 RepID=A0A222WID0_9BACL|nr:DUF3696 domain-containing protein [Paenibacillus kribbensis]ASR45782.1 hypothetical protein B4V02_03245 [Paenibacillus kribbensis]